MPSFTRTLALPASDKQRVLIFSVLWVLSVAPLFLLHSQWITGPFVNAVLILAAVILGPAEAMMIGLFPASIALASGLLPLPLAPMVPFIMISNAIYVGVFHIVRRKPMTPRQPMQPTNDRTSLVSLVPLVSCVSWVSLVSSIIIASLLKFLFLTIIARFVVSNLVPPTMVQPLTHMMGWPQLITALAGGAIAIGILTSFRKEHRA